MVCLLFPVRCFPAAERSGAGRTCRVISPSPDWPGSLPARSARTLPTVPPRDSGLRHLSSAGENAAPVCAGKVPPPFCYASGKTAVTASEKERRPGMETRNLQTLFRGLVVDVEQMEVKFGARGWHLFQIVRHPGGVGVLPLHDDGTVTLIRQLRPAVASSPRRPAFGRIPSSPSGFSTRPPGSSTRRSTSFWPRA